MFLNSGEDHQELDIVHEDFSIDPTRLSELYGDSLFIIVKSHALYIK